MQNPGTAEGFKRCRMESGLTCHWEGGDFEASFPTKLKLKTSKHVSQKSTEIFQDDHVGLSQPHIQSFVSSAVLSSDCLQKHEFLCLSFRNFLSSASPWCLHGPSSPWFASPAFLGCEAIAWSFLSARNGRNNCQTNGKPNLVSWPEHISPIWMNTQTPAASMACNVARVRAYWKDVRPWNVKSVTGNWAKCPNISKRRFAKIQLFAMTQLKVIFVAVPSTLVDVEVQNIPVTVVISSSRPMKPVRWTKWVKHEVNVKIPMFAISLEMLIHVLMVGASGIVPPCVVRMEAVSAEMSFISRKKGTPTGFTEELTKNKIWLNRFKQQDPYWYPVCHICIRLNYYWSSPGHACPEYFGGFAVKSQKKEDLPTQNEQLWWDIEWSFRTRQGLLWLACYGRGDPATVHRHRRTGWRLEANRIT